MDHNSIDINRIIGPLLNYHKQFNKLLEENHNLIRTNDSLKDDVKFGKYEINKLQEKADNFERVKEHYGVKQIEEILRLSKEQERLKREYENRWRR